MDLIAFISPLLETLGPFVYLVVLLISILESLVIVGIFIPGAVFISFVGFVAATDSLSLPVLLALTTLGAGVGDSISYYLGRRGGAPLLRAFGGRYFRESYLEAGKSFLMKHGNKSVFLGRFLAPLRPFIPFVAGMFKMGFWRFTFWNILSAFFWGGVYLAIGYIFGSAWNTIVEWVGMAGVIAFILVALSWGGYLVVNRLAKFRKSGFIDKNGL